MTLKELSQLYYLNREIDRDVKRLEELKAKAISLRGSNITGMPRSNSFGSSSIERNAAEIADLEAIISAKLTQCLHERSRLERYIADIPDSLTRMIFTLRFIDGLSWIQVAYHIGGYNTADSVRMACNRYIEKENKKDNEEDGN